MTQEPQRERPWLTLALFSCAVLTVAIALGAYAQPEMPPGGGPGALIPRTPPPPTDFPALLFQLGVGSVVWYAAALAFPLLLTGARLLDVERLGTARTAAVGIGVTLVLIVVTSAFDYIWTYGFAPVRPGVAAYIPTALRRHALALIAVAGVTAALEGRRRAVAHAIDRERLQAEVARQRLIALSGQLRPHFLFNTLQAISTLIHRDPGAADEMLTKLGDLLRDVLRHRDRPFVSLADEIKYARTWLEIAQVRFGDRLRFEIDVPDAIGHLSVPLFILQPLLENALTHGIGCVLQGGRVVVRGRLDGSRLQLQVSDDGAGLDPSAARREGIGLGNTRERLQAAFAADHELRCEPGLAGGTVVSIDIPARTEAAA